MKVKKTVNAYRKGRGDYEVELKPGETLHVRGLMSLVVHGEVSNVINVKCTEITGVDWVDMKLKRKIEVE